MCKAAKILTLTVVLACGVAFSGCGEEDRSHLLPGDSVQEIEANIDTVQEQVNEGLCFDALESADRVQKQAESLPQSVDRELKRSLVDGAVTLIQLVRNNCEETGATTEEVDPVEPELEETVTGETGTTEEEEPTGPTGKTGTTGNRGNSGNTGSTGPQNRPNPKPDPTQPVTPTPPPATDPPDDTGPGSGGITPNQ